MFENMFKDIWAKKEPTILGQYRKTGTSWSDHKEVGGVYPELDTGGALFEISDILPEVRGEVRKEAIWLVTCGNAEPLRDLPNIGEYWKEFDTVPLGKDTKRDAEAYYLDWLFRKGRFQMTVGFRSGALDLYTFLGIPTVSIGLRNMRGESRHVLLAIQELKRYNVQYDKPRHYTTAYYLRERVPNTAR